MKRSELIQKLWCQMRGRIDSYYEYDAASEMQHIANAPASQFPFLWAVTQTGGTLQSLGGYEATFFQSERVRENYVNRSNTIFRLLDRDEFAPDTTCFLIWDDVVIETSLEAAKMMAEDYMGAAYEKWCKIHGRIVPPAKTAKYSRRTMECRAYAQ